MSRPLPAPRWRTAAPRLLAASGALAALPAGAAAQLSYQQPPAPIARALDAEPLPAVSVSPDR